MIRTIPMYQVVCDLCGYVEENSDYVAWTEPGHAEMTAEDSEWDVEEGNHLCPDCIPPLPDDDEEGDGT